MARPLREPLFDADCRAYVFEMSFGMDTALRTTGVFGETEYDEVNRHAVPETFRHGDIETMRMRTSMWLLAGSFVAAGAACSSGHEEPSEKISADLDTVAAAATAPSQSGKNDDKTRIADQARPRHHRRESLVRPCLRDVQAEGRSGDRQPPREEDRQRGRQPRAELRPRSPEERERSRPRSLPAEPRLADAVLRAAARPGWRRQDAVRLFARGGADGRERGPAARVRAAPPHGMRPDSRAALPIRVWRRTL